MTVIQTKQYLRHYGKSCFRK